MKGDVPRRRSWTTAEKVRLVEETMQPGMSVSYVAHRAGIPPSQLFAWKRRIVEGGAPTNDADDNVVAAAARVSELEKRVHELERVLGKKIMEIESLKASLDRATPQGPAFRPAMCKDDGSQ
jgi:transposase